jgi:4-hydroxy-tetrahydrodipicolinate synthase
LTTTTPVPAALPTGGVIPPLVTPLHPDRSPDLDSFDRLVGRVAEAGVTGILVLGSTGENGMLSRDERLVVAGHAVERWGVELHVMVGVPAMGMKDAAVDAAAYAALGAGSLLVPANYGFALSPSELAEYFRHLDRATGATPVVLYNVPTRVGINLEPALVVELARAGTIAGVKDSSGNLEAHRLIADGTGDLEGFRRFTGSELAIDAALLAGFHGAVPGLANVFADRHVRLVARAAAGDWPAAATEQAAITRCSRLYDAPRSTNSFSGVAVGALKEALVQLGVIDHATTSPPFGAPDPGLGRHVAAVLADAGAGT